MLPPPQRQLIPTGGRTFLHSFVLLGRTVSDTPAGMPAFRLKGRATERHIAGRESSDGLVSRVLAGEAGGVLVDALTEAAFKAGGERDGGFAVAVAHLVGGRECLAPA